MKLTIRRAPFQKILEQVFEAIPAQTSEPAYKNFLLDVSDAGITVLGSGGDLSIQGVISVGDKDNPIINSEAGRVQVPAKLLLDIVKNLRSDIVILQMVDSNVLYVSDEQSQYQLNVMKPEEYPDIDITSDSKENVTIPMKEFVSLYGATAFAAATKGPRELFMGVNISILDGRLTFVTTDSFRLARKYVAIDGEHHVSITVLTKALTVVTHMAENEFVTLYVDPTKALFKIGNMTVVSKLYNGEFPNVDRIIPTEIHYTLTVDARELVSAIGRMKIVADSSSNKPTKILVNAAPDKVEISTRNATVGSSKEVLTGAVFEGDRFSILFNGDYVCDAVKALNSEKVTLAFCGDNRAFLVKSDDESVTQVITPMRSYD